MSNKIICGRCREANNPGARTCESCGAVLSAASRRKALGHDPRAWLAATAVGQMAPFLLLVLLLAGVAAVHPAEAGARGLLLLFGLVGLVSLGATFPLLKGHYDFAAGPIAGLAAVTAALMSPYGALTAIFCAVLVGCLVGLLNGWVVGWTRLGSAMVTVISGVVALQLTLYATQQADLVVSDPLLTSLGDTNVIGLPVVLALFLLALALAKILLAQRTFWPVGGAASPQEAALRGASQDVLAAFLVSGLMSGVAGVLIASSGFTSMGSSGSLIWLLTPLAAALIGGASVSGGTGNLRTATVGAAVVATTNWLTAQLRMPTTGPLVEAPYLVIGLLADRWKEMTWYMIVQVRRGNLLALPPEMRLPMVVRLWKRTSWPVRVASLLGVLILATGIFLYVTVFAAARVPEGTAIAGQVTGLAQVTRAGRTAGETLVVGASLRPGDLITTGRGGQVLLRLADGSRVEVYESSEMLIKDLSTTTAGGSVTTLQVASGGFLARVHKLLSRQSTFTVESPVLTLGVRGTVFQMQVDPSRGQVAVNEGLVQVERQYRAADMVTGQVTTLQGSDQVGAGRKFSAERGRARTSLGVLSLAERTVMDQAVAAIREQERNLYVGVLKDSSLRGLIFGLVILYLAFLAFVRPDPPGYLPELLAKRALELEAPERHGSRDPSQAVALAQMYLRAGFPDQARRQLQWIIDNEPKSDYGQWALRMRAQLDRAKPRATK
ncbi:MAG TPA: FecR domain-containing protein [Armatimonadota bacterium]|jgi:ribose transport system permease protein